MLAAKALISLCTANLSEPSLVADAISTRALVKSAYQNFFYLFLNQNICCGYSKEPSP